MKYFISAMPGCGNYGDDLISQYLIEEIKRNDPSAIIGILCGDEKIYTPHGENVIKLNAPRKNSPSNYFGRLKAIKSFLADIEYFLVGGGGLLQDVHSKYNIHGYLRYIEYLPKNAKLVMAGIGYGPIVDDFSKDYLTKLLGVFDKIIVRDIKSQKSLQEYTSVNVELQPDIVEGGPHDKTKASKENILGLSIRPWKGIEPKDVINLVDKLLDANSYSEVNSFVFEHTDGYPEEYNFAQELKKLLDIKGVKNNIFCYGKDNYDSFINELSKVSNAIATRFHANILWQQLGTSCIPLTYAPKVKALYEDKGVKLLDIKDALAGNDLAFKKIEFPNSFRLNCKEVEKKGREIKKSDVSLIKKVNKSELVSSLKTSILLRLKR